MTLEFDNNLLTMAGATGFFVLLSLLLILRLFLVAKLKNQLSGYRDQLQLNVKEQQHVINDPSHEKNY